MKEIKVYIASPYTNGRMPTNVKRQIVLSNILIEKGYYPFAPLLYHFVEIYSEHLEEKWLEMDFVFLKTCDAVLRIKPVDETGKEILSRGADQEEALAKKEGIPVFYSVEELDDYFKAKSTQAKLNI